MSRSCRRIGDEREDEQRRSAGRRGGAPEAREVRRLQAKLGEVMMRTYATRMDIAELVKVLGG